MQIICLGDSITDCNHLFEDFPLGNGYVRMLSEMFQKHTINISDTMQFKNYGIDGFTVARVLENVRLQKIPLHRSPIITLLIGINDIGLMMNTDRIEFQKKQMMQGFVAHYEELLKLLTRDARQVILMEPFIVPHPEEYQTWIPYVRTMSTHIRQLSEKFNLPFLPLHDYFNNEAIQQGFNKITTDGIHLTQYGHRLLSSLLYNAIIKECR